MTLPRLLRPPSHRLAAGPMPAAGELQPGNPDSTIPESEYHILYDDRIDPDFIDRLSQLMAAISQADSPWWRQLMQYGVKTAIPGYVLPFPCPDPVTPDALASQGVLLRAPYRVVFTLTLSNVIGSSRAGVYNVDWCAYHDADDDGWAYAICPRPRSGGCEWNNLAPDDAWTVAITHEWAEALTDRDGRGWWDRGNGEEDADLCNGQPFWVSVGGRPMAASRFWDNAKGQCGP